MQKPLALSIAFCLGLTGCHVFEKSETWNQVVKVRPGETTLDPDPSHEYAAKLHAGLMERGIAHKVVVYQYHYTTRHHEEAVGTRTAVVYRDDSSGIYPWWLKDDRLNNPFWLPNGDLDKQISFYIRRKAEVIEAKEYPAGGGSGKSALAFAKPVPALRPIVRPAPQVAVTRITPPKKAPAPVIVQKPAPAPAIVKAPVVIKAPEVKAPVVVKAHEPVTAPVVAKAPEATRTGTAIKAPQPKKPESDESVAQTLVTKIKLAAAVLIPQHTPEPDSAPPAPIASRGNTGNSFWSPPSVLDPQEQSSITAPRDAHLEKLFRAKHGCEYNRFSPTDRRKMQQLQHEFASRE